MDNLTLRKATERDGEFAYCVKKAAFKECVEQVRGWNEEEQRRFHQERFSTQGFRIIRLAGRDVGVMAMVVGPDCLKLSQLLLLPEHQGKGIGTRCMTLVMNEGRRPGLPLRLGVLKVNVRALAFYRRRPESVRTGETETHVLMQRGHATKA